MLSGIDYLHKLRICHWDLKPENLLLTSNGLVKIVDFGLSNIYAKNNLLKTACGSPCYAAPEMIAGRQYQGLKADLWSLGVILYAMVCGYLPFEDKNTNNLYWKIMNGEYSIPSFISEESADLLWNILEIDPKKRFTLEEIRSHKFC